MSACSHVRSRVSNPLRQIFQRLRIIHLLTQIRTHNQVLKPSVSKMGTISKISVKLSLYNIITFQTLLMFSSGKEYHFETLPLVDKKPCNLFPHYEVCHYPQQTLTYSTTSDLPSCLVGHTSVWRILFCGTLSKVSDPDGCVSWRLAFSTVHWLCIPLSHPGLSLQPKI